MRYYKFDNMNLSKIILGGDYYGSLVSEKDVFSLIDKYVYLGGNFFDTARLYTDGTSEEIYGKWLKKHGRDNYFLATKGGCHHMDGKNVGMLAEKEVKTDLDNSLKALGIDCVDLYYLHRDDETIPVEEIIGYLNKFVQEGKIKNIGVSNWKGRRIKAANDYALKNGLKPIVFSQIKYSYAKTNPSYSDELSLVEMDESEYNFYKENNIPVAAYASQAKGFFSKMHKKGADNLDDKTSKRYLYKDNVEKYKRVTEIAEKYNITHAAVSLCYLVSKDIDVLPVIGCKSVAQLMDSIEGVDTVLTNEDVLYLEGKC